MKCIKEYIVDDCVKIKNDDKMIIMTPEELMEILCRNPEGCVEEQFFFNRLKNAIETLLPIGFVSDIKIIFGLTGMNTINALIIMELTDVLGEEETTMMFHDVPLALKRFFGGEYFVIDYYNSKSEKIYYRIETISDIPIEIVDALVKCSGRRRKGFIIKQILKYIGDKL